MSGIVLGIILLAVSLYMVLPMDWALGWTDEFLFVIRGGLPLLLTILAPFFILISIADMYDAKSVKKQEEELKARLKKKEQEQQNQK